MNQFRADRCIAIAKQLQDLRTGRALHFSFILKNNQLLVTATNSYLKSHPSHKFGIYESARENQNYKPGLHSEIAAIKTFINKFRNSDFSGLTLFNVRISKTGEVQLAAPCRNCSKVLDSFNFKAILYT